MASLRSKIGSLAWPWSTCNLDDNGCTRSCVTRIEHIELTGRVHNSWDILYLDWVSLCKSLITMVSHKSQVAGKLTVYSTSFKHIYCPGWQHRKRQTVHGHLREESTDGIGPVMWELFSCHGTLMKFRGLHVECLCVIFLLGVYDHLIPAETELTWGGGLSNHLNSYNMLWWIKRHWEHAMYRALVLLCFGIVEFSIVSISINITSLTICPGASHVSVKDVGI